MKKLFFTIALISAFSASAQTAEEGFGIETQTLAPLTERFILDEVRNLRVDLETVHRELNEKIVTREYEAVNKALSYSSNALNYFSFFLTLAIGFLAIFGWRSIKEIKDSAHNMVEKESNKIVKDLRRRIEKTEEDLDEKRKSILKSQQEFEARQKINTLWGNASREKDDRKKLEILEEIQKLSHMDSDVFAKKSGAYLRIGLVEAALKATENALLIDPTHSIALYNKACAHARLGNTEAAIKDLTESITINPNLKSSAETDKDLNNIRNRKEFAELLK